MAGKVKNKKQEGWCEGCGQLVPKAELKSQVSSQKHSHHTAHKVQKRFSADIFFVNVKTGEFQKLCLKCQSSVIAGFSNGGMYG